MELNDGPKNQGFCDCLPLESAKEKSDLRVIYSVQKKKCYTQNTQVFRPVIKTANKEKCLGRFLPKIRVPVQTGNGLCCATTSRSAKKIPADAQLTVGTCTGVRMPAFTLPKSVGKSEQKGPAILTRDYI
jgi:hypothetical protein